MRAGSVDDLGLDGAINHRTDDLAAQLKELCPKRVDVFFDNVGGPVLDAVLARLANGGRVVLCGAISSYNDDHRPPGPANYLNLIQRRASMRGFLTLDHWGRFGEIQPMLAGLGRVRASCATAPRSSTASSRRSTPSTPCSPATTPARSSSARGAAGSPSLGWRRTPATVLMPAAGRRRRWCRFGEGERPASSRVTEMS